jgi:hypothetical protein
MKYLKSYNESLIDLMIPKSDVEILKSLKGLSNYNILRKSIENEFLKGVELALQNGLTSNDIDYIISNIFFINNKEIINLILDKIRNEFTNDQIYILEKYVFGLHQNEFKDYEIWFKTTMLTNLNISRSKQNPIFLIYKKDNVILYKYNENNRYFWIDYDKIWSIFKSKFHLNYYEIKLLTKGMVEEHLNLKDITTEANPPF